MEKVQSNKNTKLTFDVSGMTCASCAVSVEKIIKAQNGVNSIAVNLATNYAIVDFIPELISKEEIIKTASSIGYGLSIENPNIDKIEIANQSYKKSKSDLIFSALFTLPVFVISMFYMDLPYGDWIMLIFTFPVIFWFGKSFFINAFKKAKHFQASMDTLVALSASIAFLFSLFNMFFAEYWHKQGIHAHLYFESSAVVITFILFGKLLEERAKASASISIKKLIGLQSKTAFKIENEKQIEVPIKDIKIGDILQIKPGNKIPVDGEILFGNTFIDESSISGEPIPVEKSRGSKVFAGTINQNGSFRLTTKKVGDDTLLAQIISMVSEALMSKPPIQKLVDKVASVFVPVVILISIITFLIWNFSGVTNGFNFGLISMVTVLIVACPCALGLATPTAIMVGVGKGAEMGILIKDSDSLELASKINAIVFDKTGTLTEGKPEINDIRWFISDDEIIENKTILNSIEHLSEHPLASAVIKELKKDKLQLTKFEKFEYLTGKGIIANQNGNQYFVGNIQLINENNIQISEDTQRQLNEANSANTIIYFANSNKLIAVISISDKIKVNSKKAVGELISKGIEVYLLSGDNSNSVSHIAKELGIKNFKSELLPNDKAEFIKSLQKQNKIVAMVGDGINDSQALAQANVSIAMGKGSDIAIEVANITLINSDLLLVNKAIELSKLTLKTIKQNLFWAFIYNVIGIPIAAGLLFPINGFLLNPMIAGAAMALSSVSVVSNSILMKYKV
ncbi:MAG: heavy metal translocating P-type ATPase [Candidatus Kapabacteria bacterium]|nr:heavy metal translocating P-type ATPase [Candidatus Kapabacteria bacterium]